MLIAFVLLAVDPPTADQLLSPGWIVGGSTSVLAVALMFVLRWLVQVHLPLKEAQIQGLVNDLKEAQKRHEDGTARLVADYYLEREKDRASRHNVANAFQATIAEVSRERLIDSEKNRATMLEASHTTAEAVRTQTVILTNEMQKQTNNTIKAIGEGCHFQPQGQHLIAGPKSS